MRFGPNKAALRLWVAKLRDPKSRQTQNVLGIENGGRCCLGIACDIAVEQKIIPAPILDVGGGILVYDGSTSTLPKKVADWLGISDNPFLVTGDDVYYYNTRSATSLNDSEGWSFAQIADAVERTYKLNEPDDEEGETEDGGKEA